MRTVAELRLTVLHAMAFVADQIEPLSSLEPTGVADHKLWRRDEHVELTGRNLVQIDVFAFVFVALQ